MCIYIYIQPSTFSPPSVLHSLLVRFSPCAQFGLRPLLCFHSIIVTQPFLSEVSVYLPPSGLSTHTILHQSINQSILNEIAMSIKIPTSLVPSYIIQGLSRFTPDPLYITEQSCPSQEPSSLLSYQTFNSIPIHVPLFLFIAASSSLQATTTSINAIIQTPKEPFPQILASPYLVRMTN